MRSLSGLLPGFLQGLSGDPEATLAFLEELWLRVVGEQVARRTRPVALRGGRLTCSVPHEGWRDQLESMRPLLIRSINGFWGCRLIDRIEFESHQHRA